MLFGEYRLMDRMIQSSVKLACVAGAWKRVRREELARESFLYFSSRALLAPPVFPYTARRKYYLSTCHAGYEKQGRRLEFSKGEGLGEGVLHYCRKLEAIAGTRCTSAPLLKILKPGDYKKLLPAFYTRCFLKMSEAFIFFKKFF